jgi:hypothetical protein
MSLEYIWSLTNDQLKDCLTQLNKPHSPDMQENRVKLACISVDVPQNTPIEALKVFRNYDILVRGIYLFQAIPEINLVLELLSYQFINRYLTFTEEDYFFVDNRKIPFIKNVEVIHQIGSETNKAGYLFTRSTIDDNVCLYEIDLITYKYKLLHDFKESEEYKFINVVGDNIIFVDRNDCYGNLYVYCKGEIEIYNFEHYFDPNYDTSNWDISASKSNIIVIECDRGLLLFNPETREVIKSYINGLGSDYYTFHGDEIRHYNLKTVDYIIVYRI